MTGLTKLIIGLISTLIIAILSYFIFKTNKVFDIVLPKNEDGKIVRETVLNVRDKVYKKIDEFIAPVKNKVNENINNVFEKAQDEVSEVLNEAKQNAAESIKKSFNDKIDAISGKSSISASVSSGVTTANTVNLIDNFPLGFSVKRGVPAIFIMKSNNDDKIGFSYSVNWGDGKKDTGEVVPSGATTIYHIWEQSGEYSIKVTTKFGESSKNYSSYILVY